ncbi:MAG: glycosyltransferase family 4 protein [Candidatus Njordarchaeales archaeon]
MNRRANGKGRILFFLDYPNPYPGASWARIGFFAKYLQRRGYEVRIIGGYFLRETSLAGARKWNNIQIINVYPIMRKIFTTPFIILSTIISLIISLIILLTFKPDLIIISVPPGENVIGLHMASKILKKKTIFDYRDEWEEYLARKTKNRMAKILAEILRKVMMKIYSESKVTISVTSEFTRRLRREGIKAITIYNGVDLEEFKWNERRKYRRKLKISSDTLIIAFNGHIYRDWYYKMDIVAKAIAQLKNENLKLKLMLIGKILDPNFLKLISELKLKKDIIYLGVKRDRREIAEALSSADVGVIPGLYTEGQIPAKFFEYCACHLPTIAIAPSNSELAKIISKHKLGIVCETYRPEEMADAIRTIYYNEEFRREAGERAYQLVKIKFNRKKQAEKLEKIISMIM